MESKQLKQKLNNISASGQHGKNSCKSNRANRENLWHAVRFSSIDKYGYKIYNNH